MSNCAFLVTQDYLQQEFSSYVL